MQLKDIQRDKNIELATIIHPKQDRSLKVRSSTIKTKSQTTSRLDKATVWGLEVQYDTVYKIEDKGEKETYDLQVIGPWENFSAGGAVVHNSVNEYSTRYSIAIDEAQRTACDEWRSQSTNNKQGSGNYLESDVGSVLTQEETEFLENARKVYESRINHGVAREQARKDLPLSTYTSAYWKIDLHNLFHFLSLRMDSHAQLEIRSFATTIGEQIVKPLFPLAWEAFEDYRLGAMNFSKQELFILGRLLATTDVSDDNISDLSGCWPDQSRERTEFVAKVKKMITTAHAT